MLGCLGALQQQVPTPSYDQTRSLASPSPIPQHQPLFCSSTSTTTTTTFYSSSSCCSFSSSSDHLIYKSPSPAHLPSAPSTALFPSCIDHASSSRPAACACSLRVPEHRPPPEPLPRTYIASRSPYFLFSSFLFCSLLDLSRHDRRLPRASPAWIAFLEPRARHPNLLCYLPADRLQVPGPSPDAQQRSRTAVWSRNGYQLDECDDEH